MVMEEAQSQQSSQLFHLASRFPNISPSTRNNEDKDRILLFEDDIQDDDDRRAKSARAAQRRPWAATSWHTVTCPAFVCSLALLDTDSATAARQIARAAVVARATCPRLSSAGRICLRAFCSRRPTVRLSHAAATTTSSATTRRCDPA